MDSEPWWMSDAQVCDVGSLSSLDGVALSMKEQVCRTPRSSSVTGDSGVLGSLQRLLPA